MPDDITKNNGFVINGKRYAVDTGADPSNPGDISKDLKNTLAGYMSDVTLGRAGSAQNGVSNRYPVSPKQADFSTTQKGYPIPPYTSQSDAFVYANSLKQSTSKAYVPFNGKFNKGLGPDNNPDGNNVASTVTKVDGTRNEDNVVVQYTDSVLKNNRFTSDATMYAGVDVRHPSSFNPVVGNYNDNNGVSMGRLAQIAPVLSARAALKLGSTDDRENINSVGGSAQALLPGAAQTAAVKVPNYLLEARDVLNKLTLDEVSSANYIDINSKSWGSLNTTEDWWSGVSANGMTATSAAMTAALLLIIDGLSLLVGMISSNKVPSSDPLGRKTLGSSYSDNKSSTTGPLGLNFNIGAMLGIRPTHQPFARALNVGANAFFGVATGDVPDSIKNFLISALGPDAGYHLVVSRTIVRSADTIVDKVANIFKNGNFIEVAKQIIGLVEVLRSSKIIAACNVFAQLGDKILSTPTSNIDSQTPGVMKISSMDDPNMPGSQGALLSRIPGTKKLSWAGNRARSMMFLPSPVLAAAQLTPKLGAAHATSGGGSTDPNKFNPEFSLQKDGSQRIDPDDVAKLESVLDAEYVPFYFHDLRTNEIISFHAFIASLGDSYSAGYESTDGHGRVEPVKIYKGTTRKIDISFHMVATSYLDFEDMWVKINKLVTLVYPQYTAGTMLQNKTGTYKFTQPFSQLVGASPMVRLRLGDLFRSNYSKFALARLFGLGEQTVKFAGDSQIDINSLTNKLTYENQIDKLLLSPSGETWIPESKTYVQYSESSGLPSVPFSSGNGPYAPEFMQEKDFFLIKAVGTKGQLVIGEVQINDNANWNIVPKQSMVDACSNPANLFVNYIGGRYLFDPSDLKPTAITAGKAKQSTLDSLAATSLPQDIVTFLDDNKNAIARSFKDTGGKGLAGFIETMSFDWYDNVTWETAPNSKAPQSCKVTLGFSPIHDISPGIDQWGYNRAPVYNVGRMSANSGNSTGGSTTG